MPAPAAWWAVVATQPRQQPRAAAAAHTSSALRGSLLVVRSPYDVVRVQPFGLLAKVVTHKRRQHGVVEVEIVRLALQPQARTTGFQATPGYGIGAHAWGDDEGWG